jgi:glycosyltransferase 2 family protein
LGAIALYALATVVRAERWQRLLEDEGAAPTRADTYALTCVGYAGNNVLPARAGDAIRMVLMAPRAGASKRTVIGTLLAERLLDVAVLVMLFVVVGWGLLGEVGGDKVEIVALVLAGVAVAAVAGYVVVRRNQRLTAFLAPIASSTLGLRRAHHGLLLLGMTLVIWGIEAGVWMSTAAAVGFGMDPIEGLYIVALASVFSLIPSGPAYAGTQDAAAILGIKALGGTGAQAVAYIVMLRFVIVVPITIVGLGLLAARYGGLGRLRRVRAEAGG